jgi:hypothetical protein
MIADGSGCKDRGRVLFLGTRRLDTAFISCTAGQVTIEQEERSQILSWWHYIAKLTYNLSNTLLATLYGAYTHFSRRFSVRRLSLLLHIPTMHHIVRPCFLRLELQFEWVSQEIGTTLRIFHELGNVGALNQVHFRTLVC